MNEEKIERSIVLYAWGYALVGTLLLLGASFIWFPNNLTYLPVSFILGVCTNLMCFTLTVKVIDFLLNNKIKKSKSIMIGLNLVKLVMYGIVLALAVLVNSLEVFSCLAGMMAVKLMIYFKHLVVEPIQNKSKNKIESKDGDNFE